jgi:hypothetical protein
MSGDDPDTIRWREQDLVRWRADADRLEKSGQKELAERLRAFIDELDRILSQV